MIVGRIDWGATDLLTETITIYNPGTNLNLGTAILAATDTGALDQGTFDMLVIQFKDATPRIDEIRFGKIVEHFNPTPYHRGCGVFSGL